MGDDWRIQVTAADHRTVAELAQALERGGVANDLDHAASGRVVVSVDSDEMFLYAGSRDQAERAAQAVAVEAARRNLAVRTSLRRWHPAALEWEDPDTPLPADPESEQAEHAELIAAERADSERYGTPDWEVKVACDSHADTVALANDLRAKGIPSVRRWRYLLVGAADEDAARALAAEIGPLAPAGGTVTVEETLAAVERVTPANPFAVFGGLGG